MKKVYKKLIENFKVNGENGKYATLYESVEDIENAEMIEEDILSTYRHKEKDVNKLNYPIIVFDDAGATGGLVFEADEVDEVIQAAEQYFEER